MAGSEKYWADALALSPGKQLASMQEQMFASETTDGLMIKFDRSIISMTAGIVDPTELQAAQMRAQMLLAEKQTLAPSRASMTAAEVRSAVIKLVVKAGIQPDLTLVRTSRGLMARRWFVTAIMLTLILMQSVAQVANAPAVRHSRRAGQSGKSRRAGRDVVPSTRAHSRNASHRPLNCAHGDPLGTCWPKMSGLGERFPWRCQP